MTAEEVADLLKLKPSTVMEYARRGELPSIVLGRSRRFLRADVEAALMAKRTGRSADVVPLRSVRRAS
jgi:excisionase family DNA binding protein